MKRGVLYVTGLLVLVNLGLLVGFLIRAPRPAADGPTVQTAATTAAGIFSVTGVVRELRADGTNLLIRHEAIPGYMPAMTMPFTARDPREVASLQPGDTVTFRLLVTDEESWIDQVERQKTADGARPPEPAFQYESARIVRDVEPLEPGDRMPDYVFTNQFGKPAMFSDFRGRTVALTFIFTRCPLPEFCPRMLKNFSAVAEALEAEGKSGSGGLTNWNLISATIDPAFDTPEVLRNHAERYDYDARRWSFWTGALIDIDALTEQLGLVYRRQTPESIPDHNLRTAVIDAEGRLRKVIIGNTWKPEELVADMKEAATTPWPASATP